jgi:hypothetical protein
MQLSNPPPEVNAPNRAFAPMSYYLNQSKDKSDLHSFDETCRLFWFMMMMLFFVVRFIMYLREISILPTTQTSTSQMGIKSSDPLEERRKGHLSKCHRSGSMASQKLSPAAGPLIFSVPIN